MVILGIIVIAMTVITISISTLKETSETLKDRMENDFRKNEEIILIVKDYLVDVVYDDLHLSAYEKAEVIFTSDSGRILIENNAVSEAIRKLFDYGYVSITKRNNCIVFDRWGSKVRSYGIVYSIDGRTPSESSFTFLTYIERLSEKGWYYYIEDLNEHKRIESGANIIT